MLENIRSSVEKAKAIIDQFKSLTKAQEIKPTTTPLKPILEDAIRVARNSGVTCTIECPDNLLLYGDPDRLGECFDELAVNCTHWFDKPTKLLSIIATRAPAVPSSVDSSKEYALIHFTDNGKGVPIEVKNKTFDAFFTTHEHGTGLGLALVRRIIDGHGGAVAEVGKPGEGADFEIYLPLGPKEQGGDAAPVRDEKKSLRKASVAKARRGGT